MNGAAREADAAIPAVAAPDPSVLRETGCGLCGSQRNKTRFESPPYRVVECQDCGLVYVTPRRDAAKLRELYLDEYWRSPAAKDYGYTDYLRDEPLYLKTYKKRYRALERRVAKPGKLLDVGCAAGYFLSVAKARGWECTGVEVSPKMSQFARERYGLDVRTGTLPDQQFPAGHFDCITFWDVVEHLDDPVAILREARRLIAPNGILLIETQNVASGAARRLGPKWHHYKHAEHIYHFDPRTVHLLLEKAGFEMLDWQSALGGKYVSLDFIVERANRLHPAVSFLLSPLKALGRASFYVNLGDEMIVFARPM